MAPRPAHNVTKPPSTSPLTTPIEHDRLTLAALRHSAAVRDLSVPTLVQHLVEIIAEEPALVGAILDDGH
jgi:hypothetical protein